MNGSAGEPEILRLRAGFGGPLNRSQNTQIALVLPDELHRSARFPGAEALDDARVIQLHGVAEHMHQQRAGDGVAAAAAQAFQSDLQRVEAELDVLIEQLPLVWFFGT